MFNPIGIDLFNSAYRAILILGLPLAIAGVVAGIVAASLQGFLRIQDPALSYVVRLVAILIVLGVFFSTQAQALQNMLILVLQ